MRKGKVRIGGSRRKIILPARLVDKNEVELSRNFRLKGSLLLFVLPLLFVLASLDGHSQFSERTPAGMHGKKTITAIRTDLPVVVDGNLNEPAWHEAQVSSGFIQKEPLEGEPSTERTEFRILYNTTTLYIGVICYDSDPEAILATEQRRDNRLESDDTITLVLDTFHDHRNAFLFRTNALGTQYDAQITDEGNGVSTLTLEEENLSTQYDALIANEGIIEPGNNVNGSWNEKWEVASQVNELGWTAEFAIPFNSLRMNGKDNQVWALDLERVIRRKNEFVYWNSFERGFNLEHISQGGHLEGLENIELGRRWRVKPFLLGGFTQSSAPSGSTFRNASAWGMEVLKYRITPSLTADLTWKTDFAEGEIDRLKVNLSRFPILFPEKREFFQEEAGIFDFGNVDREKTRELQLFHSRRIGLTPSTKAAVPIRGGGRITGKLQGFTLGLLNVQTGAQPSEGIPASNYGVLRVKRDVLSRSTVGAFLINREEAGSGDFNRIYGVDGKFVFRKHFTIDGFLGKSAEPSSVEDNWVAGANANWNSDFLLVGMEYLSIDPNFRDDVGYIRRGDIRRFSPSLAIRPRPNIRGIRQIEISGRWDYVVNQKNRLAERADQYAVQVAFQNGDSFRIVPFQHSFDRVQKRTQIKGIRIPAGDYSWNSYTVRYQRDKKRQFAGSLSFVHSYGYYAGNLYQWSFSPILKLSKSLSADVNYKISALTLPGGASIDHTVDASINYAFTKQWLTSTILQYQQGSSLPGLHFRLNYIIRPGSDLFLIYNETRAVVGENRTLLAKFTYSFDF